MKSFSKSKLLVLLAVTLLSVPVLFTSCTRSTASEGYKGELKDTSAKKLVNICHFIPRSEIEDWVTRFKRDSAEKMFMQHEPAINYLLSNSCSFNSCIIRKLINDPKSIGLRVIYGMSPDRRLHVILVGINPDYSNLYIDKPEDCCGKGTEAKGADNSPAGLLGGGGGAEYGQMP